MKTAFFLLILMIINTAAYANDVSCQSDLMKPKLNATMNLSESEKPAQLTVSETKIRLKDKRSKTIEKSTENTISATEEKPTAKKGSSLGDLFEILLPAKLRNPVK